MPRGHFVHHFHDISTPYLLLRFIRWYRFSFLKWCTVHHFWRQKPPKTSANQCYVEVLKRRRKIEFALSFLGSSQWHFEQKNDMRGIWTFLKSIAKWTLMCNDARELDAAVFSIAYDARVTIIDEEEMLIRGSTTWISSSSSSFC